MKMRICFILKYISIPIIVYFLCNYHTRINIVCTNYIYMYMLIIYFVYINNFRTQYVDFMYIYVANIFLKINISTFVIVMSPKSYIHISLIVEYGYILNHEPSSYINNAMFELKQLALHWFFG